MLLKHKLSNDLMKNFQYHRKQKWNTILMCFMFSTLFSIICHVANAQTKQAKRIGDFIESKSYNDEVRGTKRTLQYTPVDGRFYSLNGKNRFTRALYSHQSHYRIETSDKPVFALYNKSKNRHLRFCIETKETRIALDSISFCESYYEGGKRTYTLRHDTWGDGSIELAVLPFRHTNGGIWKFVQHNMPRNTKLHAELCPIKSVRLNRNGDMGADPPGCFEAHDSLPPVDCAEWDLDDTIYVVCQQTEFDLTLSSQGEQLFQKAEHDRLAIVNQVQWQTPDPYINTLAGALMAAADGIWDGQVWLHGAIGWRMPLNGWRAAYTGDALGWHDRARTHFNAYAASQVTDVEPNIPHPSQDMELNGARSVKKWGTQQYSNGYICRNPHKNNQMHHYDMNLCYIDELLWHLMWTGDWDYAKTIWHVIERHLAWEKRNFDPDGDYLYDAYASIWASDALYYNSGAVTHSSAYNYRANKWAAIIAEKIGKDAQPYKKEAENILEAMNRRLWMPEYGHWAEFQDYMGLKRLHPDAAVWSIYHAIDSETATPYQAYQATRYIDTAIPHIPVKGEGLKGDYYATISTTDWLPYSWSINNVAFAEVMHTALAYFIAGRNNDAFLLLKSSILDGMYLGNSPGNWGQVSFYDAARGECYRDFGDPIGIATRLFIQGLFGIWPDALHNHLVLRPGFPSDWNDVCFKTPDIAYTMKRSNKTIEYDINCKMACVDSLTLVIPIKHENINKAKVNGKNINYKWVESANGQALISITTPCSSNKELKISVVCAGNELYTIPQDAHKVSSAKQWLFKLPKGVNIKDVYDPQGLLKSHTITKEGLKAEWKINKGHHTLFVHTQQKEIGWMQPVNVYFEEQDVKVEEQFTNVVTNRCETINIDNILNDSVTSIFKPQYLSPRSPYTTLQIPFQGIGEWCHPLLNANIDDSGLRSLITNDNTFTTSLGVPFRLIKEGKNIAFTSLWDVYPDTIELSLNGKAERAYLLMAGSTNHMQCHIANGVIRVIYTDGTETTLELINPNNWCPIEQDFFVDNVAFRLPCTPPYRLHLKSGIVSQYLGDELGITGVYGREIDGGAGVLLDIPLDSAKELKSLKIETLSNDVVIGLMGITLQRRK